MSLLAASIGEVMFLSVNSKQDGQCLIGNKILQQGKQIRRSVGTNKLTCHKLIYVLVFFFFNSSSNPRLQVVQPGFFPYLINCIPPLLCKELKNKIYS